MEDDFEQERRTRRHREFRRLHSQRFDDDNAERPDVEPDEPLNLADLLAEPRREWTLPEREPVKPPQKLDTAGPRTITETVLEARLLDERRELVRLISALAEADERAHEHAEHIINKLERGLKNAENKARQLQIDMLRMEARLANRIANLAALVAKPASDSRIVDVLPNPLSKDRSIN